MPKRRSTSQGRNPRYEHFQDWLKNLASFFYGFEAGIEKLHPKEWRTGIYCKSMHEAALLIPCPDAPDSIELIMAQTAEERLIDSLLVVSGAAQVGHTAYSFRYLSPTKKGDIEEKRTIEFRAHDATVDPEKVKVWVKFLLMVVDFAGQTAPAEMERICKDEIKRQKTEHVYDAARDLRVDWIFRGHQQME